MKECSVVGGRSVASMLLEYCLPAGPVDWWCLEMNRCPSEDNVTNRLGGEEGLSPRFVRGKWGI